MLGQILGDARCRYPGLVEWSRNIEPRSDDGRLDRVQHIEPLGQIAETVPLFARLQEPVFPEADAIAHQPIGSPYLEPPIVLAELGLHLAHRTAEIHRLADAFLAKRGTARRDRKRTRLNSSP